MRVKMDILATIVVASLISIGTQPITTGVLTQKNMESSEVVVLVRLL